MASPTDEHVERATRAATMGLLLFGSLHALNLSALFWQAPAPFTVRVGIEAAACFLAYLAAWRVWRTGSVAALIFGSIAIVGSLGRIPFPIDRTPLTIATLVLTLLLSIPVVRAIVVVARSRS